MLTSAPEAEKRTPARAEFGDLLDRRGTIDMEINTGAACRLDGG
jgi:hypothetical protein